MSPGGPLRGTRRTERQPGTTLAPVTTTDLWHTGSPDLPGRSRAQEHVTAA